LRGCHPLATRRLFRDSVAALPVALEALARFAFVAIADMCGAATFYDCLVEVERVGA
jgi:hypothetical protein